MSFSHSSSDIRVSEHFLLAKCSNGNIAVLNSWLDLNAVLGNDDGSFIWGGDAGFYSTAKNVSIKGNVLKAELSDKAGNPVRCSVNLDERIANKDGSLVFNK